MKKCLSYIPAVLFTIFHLLTGVAEGDFCHTNGLNLVLHCCSSTSQGYCIGRSIWYSSHTSYNGSHLKR